MGIKSIALKLMANLLTIGDFSILGSDKTVLQPRHFMEYLQVNFRGKGNFNDDVGSLDSSSCNLSICCCGRRLDNCRFFVVTSSKDLLVEDNACLN